jgi:opacity protein-like surface antigen
VFFDFNYVELSLGFFSVGGNWTEKEFVTGTSVKHGFSGTGVDFGVLAKYPFDINEKLKLFPFLGLSYRSVLFAELNGIKVYDPEKLSTIWFKLGGGLDYSFTEKIYLRAGFLYGIRLENQFERDTKDSLIATGARNRLSVDAESLLGHGLDVKLAIGRKL